LIEFTVNQQTELEEGKFLERLSPKADQT